MCILLGLTGDLLVNQFDKIFTSVVVKRYFDGRYEDYFSKHSFYLEEGLEEIDEEEIDEEEMEEDKDNVEER